MLNRIARVVLVALNTFLGLTAIYGAVAVVPTLPREWLDGSPFTDYTLPALGLGGVGIAALLAAVLLVMREPRGTVLSAAAGAAIVIFEAVETSVVGLDVWRHALGLGPAVPPTPATSADGMPELLGIALPLWLQPFYALLGIAIGLLALRLWYREVQPLRHAPAPARG